MMMNALHSLALSLSSNSGKKKKETHSHYTVTVGSRTAEKVPNEKEESTHCALCAHRSTDMKDTGPAGTNDQKTPYGAHNSVGSHPKTFAHVRPPKDFQRSGVVYSWLLV